MPSTARHHDVERCSQRPTPVIVSLPRRTPNAFIQRTQWRWLQEQGFVPVESAAAFSPDVPPAPSSSPADREPLTASSVRLRRRSMARGLRGGPQMRVTAVARPATNSIALHALCSCKQKPTFERRSRSSILRPRASSCTARCRPGLSYGSDGSRHLLSY